MKKKKKLKLILIILFQNEKSDLMIVCEAEEEEEIGCLLMINVSPIMLDHPQEPGRYKSFGIMDISIVHMSLRNRQFTTISK